MICLRRSSPCRPPRCPAPLLLAVVAPVVLVALTGLSSGAFAAPQVDSPLLAAFAGQPVSVHGSGFETSGTLRVRLAGRQLALPSNHPAITSWSDKRIEIQVPDSAVSGWIRVETASGSSSPVRVEVFDYEWYEIPPTPGTNPAPLSLEVDGSGRVWFNQEFHLEFHVLDPAVGSVQALAIPRPPDPGPFATTLFSDHRTQTSTLGEDVMIDPRGRVWFTQGGGSLYSGAWPNHSRIVSYDPSLVEGSRYRVYNVPGDWNEVIGLAWDPGRERIWFAEGGLAAGGKITSFDPDRIPWDNDFDFSTSLDGLVCQPGQPVDDCFQTFVLPNPGAHPAHLVVDAVGHIWYTAFWGRAIGRLEPNSGLIEDYPVPAAIGLGAPVPIVGAGPWEIVEAPDGSIVFNEFFDSTISRFQMERLGDPACLLLDASGRNPCIDEWVIPDADLAEERVHSIIFDLEGNLWYTIATDLGGAGTTASLGYWSARFGVMVNLPPLALFPHPQPASPNGVAVDPRNGDIWFCDFFRKRIGHLRKR